MLTDMGKNTRRVGAALTIALGTATLAACAGPSPISEAEYLAAADGLDSFGHMSDAALIRYGEDYCGFLREHGGGTADGRRDAAKLFLSIDADGGGDVVETALVLGHAVQRFCPEFSTD